MNIAKLSSATGVSIDTLAGYLRTVDHGVLDAVKALVCIEEYEEALKVLRRESVLAALGAEVAYFRTKLLMKGDVEDVRTIERIVASGPFNLPPRESEAIVSYLAEKFI